MADKNSRGESIPLDAKEKFLSSVKKKNRDKKDIPSFELNEEQKETNVIDGDISVLFDDNPVSAEFEGKSETEKSQDNKKRDKNNKSDKTQPKNKSSVEENDEKAEKTKYNDEKIKCNEKSDNHTYIRLPFVNIIPVFMILQSAFLVVIPFLDAEIAVTYVFVTLFWLSVIASGGLMLFVKMKYYNELDTLNRSMSQFGKIYRFVSLVNFFRTAAAKKADITFFVMSILTIIFVVLGTKNIFDHVAVIAAVLSLFLLSLNMHVFTNDSIYEYSLKFKKNKLKKEVIDNE